MKKIFFISIAFLCISNCIYAQKTTIGNGVLTSEKRTTESYDKITLIGSINVELINGSEGKLVVSGDSNLINFVETTVNNNELIIKIKEKQSYSTKKNLKVIVPIQNIISLSLKGSGDITTKEHFVLPNLNIAINGSGDIDLNVNSEKIYASVFGSGDLIIKGKTNYFNAEVKGSGDIKAKKLQSQNGLLNVNGSGDIVATVTNRLQAKVIGSGDILVFGNPNEVTKEIKGSGDITLKKK